MTASRSARARLGAAVAGLVLAGGALAGTPVAGASRSFAGFACDPNGTTGGSPTTTLSTVRVDPDGRPLLTCLFRGSTLRSAFGGQCSFDNSMVHVDFATRFVLAVNGNASLICSGGSVAQKADLSVTKTDNATDVLQGGTATYAIVVTNNGPSTAPTVTVTDPLPAGVTSMTWSNALNGHSGSGALSDTITNLAAGASATITVVAHIDAAAAGSVSNTATVAAGANTIDGNGTNNSATDTDTVTVPNSPPVANPDVFTMNEDDAVGGFVNLGNVLANDTDEQNDVLHVAECSDVQLNTTLAPSFATATTTLVNGLSGCLLDVTLSGRTAVVVLWSDGWVLVNDPQHVFDGLALGDVLGIQASYVIADPGGLVSSPATFLITINGTADTPPPG